MKDLHTVKEWSKLLQAHAVACATVNLIYKPETLGMLLIHGKEFTEVYSTDGTIFLGTKIETGNMFEEELLKQYGCTLPDSTDNVFVIHPNQATRRREGLPLIAVDSSESKLKNYFESLAAVKGLNPPPLPTFSFDVYKRVAQIYKIMGIKEIHFTPDKWDNSLSVSVTQITKHTYMYAYPLQIHIHKSDATKEFENLY